MNDQRYKVVYNEDGDGAQISDEVKEEWLFPEDCADLLNSQYERIAELEKERDALFSLTLKTAANMHFIRTDLEFDEVPKYRVNEKIRLEAINLAEQAKQLREGVNHE